MANPELALTAREVVIYLSMVMKIEVELMERVRLALDEAPRPW